MRCHDICHFESLQAALTASAGTTVTVTRIGDRAERGGHICRFLTVDYR